jgi:lysophospholipid acyltransferase (LPLAT)-like uncharacterized protein
LAASWIVAIAFRAMNLLLRATCRVRFKGGDALPTNAIFAFWHEALPIWFVTFARSQPHHAWLQHPAAYMKPTHIVLGLMGTRILLGSGGEEGRRAAAALTELLREGWSTAITPDGPAGPPHKLRKGVLHMSRDSGIPVVPVRLHAKPFLRLPTWDGKRMPLPFCAITVSYGTPIHVTADNFNECEERLSTALT